MSGFLVMCVVITVVLFMVVKLWVEPTAGWGTLLVCLLLAPFIAIAILVIWLMLVISALPIIHGGNNPLMWGLAVVIFFALVGFLGSIFGGSSTAILLIFKK